MLFSVFDSCQLVISGSWFCLSKLSADAVEPLHLYAGKCGCLIWLSLVNGIIQLWTVASNLIT